MKSLTLLLLAVTATSLAQTSATTTAQVFPSATITTQLSTLLQDAKPTGSKAITLGDYGPDKLMLSVRTASGGVEVHAHFTDVFVITDGRATLITGGTVLDATTNASGETHGTSIQNGTSQSLAKGDVVHIPAGVPHQMLLTPGDTLSYFVVKVRN
jgi:mannose-6-phosphate isomerase-like protein (cupin superfamily)